MDNKQPQLPENVSLPTELVNEILSVFSALPYNQVAQIISKIQQEAKPIEQVVPEMEQPTTEIPQLQVSPK